MKCGSSDHQLATCPKAQERSGVCQMDKPTPSQASAVGNRPRVPARVYALNHQQVPNPTEVVEGTIPIFHRLAKVLVDPGALHSFVSSAFMCGVDIKSARLRYDLETRTTTGN